MKFRNAMYDFMKWFLLIFVDAGILLIASLGTIYNFNTDTIILTISACSVFLGTITGISNYNYNKYKGR